MEKKKKKDLYVQGKNKGDEHRRRWEFYIPLAAGSVPLAFFFFAASRGVPERLKKKKKEKEEERRD